MLEQQLAEPIVYNISDNLEALEAKREEETDEPIRLRTMLFGDKIYVYCVEFST